MPNTVRAAAEGMPAINRRAMLTGTAATAAALAASTLPAEPATDSNIITLFHEWKAINDACGYDISDDDLTRVCDALNAIEDEMVSLPATTPADFAAKFLVVSGFGAYIIEEDGPLFAEALALCGTSMRATVEGVS